MSLIAENKMQIDVNNSGITNAVAVQGDHIGRKIKITLLSQGEVVDLTNCTATVKCSVNGKTIAVNSCDINANVVTVELTKTMLAYAGKIKMQVSVTDSDGAVISTPIIYLIVSESISTTPVEQTPDFSILADLTGRIMAVLNDPAVGDTEVKDARGGHTVLGDRLNSLDTYATFPNQTYNLIQNHVNFNNTSGWNTVNTGTLTASGALLTAVSESNLRIYADLEKSVPLNANASVLVKIRARCVSGGTATVKPCWRTGSSGVVIGNNYIVAGNVNTSDMTWTLGSTFVDMWFIAKDGDAQATIDRIGLLISSGSTVEVAHFECYYSQDEGLTNGEIERLVSDVFQAEVDIGNLQATVNGSASTSGTVKNQIATAKTEVVEESINPLAERVTAAESDISTLSSAGDAVRGQINELKGDIIELENVILHDISIENGRRGINGNSSIQESTQWCTTGIFELKTGDYFVFDKSFVIAQLVTIVNGSVSSTSADITSGKIDISTDGTYAVNMFRVNYSAFTDSDIDYLNKTLKVYTNIAEDTKINKQEIATAKEEIDIALRELKLETVTENIQFSVGRWLINSTSIDTSKTNYVSSGVISLKNGDVLNLYGAGYKYEIMLFDGSMAKTLLANEYIKSTYIIEQDGNYVINAFYYPNTGVFDDAKIADITQRTTYKKLTSSLDNINEAIENHNERLDSLDNKINENQNKEYIIDAKYMKYSYQGTNDNFFHTESFSSDNDITFDFNGTYGQLRILNNVTGVYDDIVKGMVVSGGTYQIYGYVTPIHTVTDEILAEVKSDIVITTTKTVYDYESPKLQTSHTPKLIPYMDGDIQKLIPVFRDDYEKPLYPVWGHEYLEHWYEKVYEGAENASVVLDGDSITEGYGSHMEGVNDAFINMRGYAIKKIMKLGNFPMEKLTVVNNGHGGRKTGEWVGDTVYGASSYVSQYPNGFLDVAMSNNPDLLIVSWGMNDADKTNTELQSLTTEGRLEVFKNHMIEGLERIRGNAPVNGRPAYNKPVSELSIILCMPTVGGYEGSGRGNYLWNQYVREILIDLCRTYQCAFADFTFRTYAHNSMNPKIWSGLTSTGGWDGIHPNKYSNAQTMSLLQDLIYPVCMWNVDTSDF